MTARISAYRYAMVPALLLVLVVANPSAQTKITADTNSYSVADDIKLGQEAAAEARKQLPMLNDDRVDAFVENIGAQLVAAIPSEHRHAGFRYTFDVVNQKEINAFALPGGPMFLNRGMSSTTPLSNVSPVTGEREYVALSTTQLRDGSLLNIVGVAPQSDAKTYEKTFRHVRQSLQIAD